MGTKAGNVARIRPARRARSVLDPTEQWYCSNVQRALTESGIHGVKAAAMALRATTCWSRALAAKAAGTVDDAAELELCAITSHCVGRTPGGRKALENDAT